MNLLFVKNPLSSSSRFNGTFSSKLSKRELKVHCKLLEVGESPTETELHENFLRLVKKFHPDSSSSEANTEKFTAVQNSYKILRENFIGLTDDSPEILEKNFEIRHTVPQHRQYLSYDGIGHGTPSQRQKQYQQNKIRQGCEKVYEFRKAKLANETEFSVAMKDATLARQYKTSHAMERLVEDMIQESIARGEFDNLPGSGKPLKRSIENPYVDSMTHKLNEILINNGFVPEWIMLGKEITDEVNNLRKDITEKRKWFGHYPLPPDEEVQWQAKIKEYASRVKNVNLKIDKFNMSAPQTTKQKIHFMLGKESNQILMTEKPAIKQGTTGRIQYKKEDKTTLFDVLWKAVTNK